MEAPGAPATPRSMTGSGAGRRQNDKFTIEVEVRSVNHRFFAIQTRMPGELAPMEVEIEERLRKAVHRGSLSVSVNLRRNSTGRRGTPDIDCIQMDQARAVAAGLRAMAKELKLSGKLTIETVASAPGVMVAQRGAAGLNESMRKLVREAIEDATNALLDAREREGRALAADLRGRVQILRNDADQIEQRVPVALAEYQQRLSKRVGDLLQEKRAALREEDLAREIALLAEKSDIAEELARLRTHIEELDGLLQTSEPAGRRMDFLLQEMGREVNTAGSKSFDMEVTRIVMNLKAGLERIREQAANLE